MKQPVRCSICKRPRGKRNPTKAGWKRIGGYTFCPEDWAVMIAMFAGPLYRPEFRQVFRG